MTERAVSKNGVAIRLPDERWAHITEEHCELAGIRLEVLETVANPARIDAGNEGDFWRRAKSKQVNFWWSCIVNWPMTVLSSQPS